MPKIKTAAALIQQPELEVEPPAPLHLVRASPPDALAALHQVPHTDDVVEYTLRCVLALVPGFSEAVAQAADRHVRELFGGERAYIARRQGEGRSARNDAIRRDHQAGERVQLLMRRYNLSREQIGRILRGE